MSLEAALTVDVGAFRLHARFDVAAGQTAVVVGPNGAGKTTLLRSLAGLVGLTDGRVVLADQVLDDVGAGIHVSPEQRPIGVVFQDYLLFPHLSALDNVAFGLRSRGTSRGDARRAAMGWLTRMGVAHKAAARPSELSGGQSQRVALARALATDPALLLLDEPLAALDVATRSEVRRDVRRHLASFPGVRLVVTHDPIEAATLADQLIVIEDGVITQQGTPAEVTGRPRSSYVAQLVGTNLIHGELHDGILRVAGGFTLATSSSVDGAASALVHPRSVALYRQRPAGSPRNVWEGKIESLETLGDRVRARITGPPEVVAEVTAEAARDLGLVDGDAVWLAVKATEVDVYPA